MERERGGAREVSRGGANVSVGPAAASVLAGVLELLLLKCFKFLAGVPTKSTTAIDDGAPFPPLMA